LFEYRDLGAVDLKGFAGSVRAWQAVANSAIESRFEARQAHGMTPLVGRDEELHLLLRRWQQAKAGEGRVVLISGEAGMGESRITAELSQCIADEPHTRLRYFCLSQHQESALHPFIVRLERAAGLARDDGQMAKLDKLLALIGEATEPGDISLIAEMMSLC